MSSDSDALYTVVAAIAEVEGVEPHQLGYALHEHVDTEAVSGLIDGEYDDWELSFQVPGHEVTLRDADGVYVDGTLVRELGQPPTID